MFHDQKWADGLASRADGSHTIEMKAGHWIMRDEPFAVNKHMDAFLAEIAKK